MEQAVRYRELKIIKNLRAVRERDRSYRDL